MDMNGHFPCAGSELPREPRGLLRLRLRLLVQGLNQIRLVYGTIAGVPQVTLTGVFAERASGRQPISSVDSDRVLRFFVHWMARAYPDWAFGPDCAGIIDWDLVAHVFAHRHCGYTQRFYIDTRTGCEGVRMP